MRQSNRRPHKAPQLLHSALVSTHFLFSLFEALCTNGPASCESFNQSSMAAAAPHPTLKRLPTAFPAPLLPHTIHFCAFNRPRLPTPVLGSHLHDPLVLPGDGRDQAAARRILESCASAPRCRPQECTQLDGQLRRSQQPFEGTDTESERAPAARRGQRVLWQAPVPISRQRSEILCLQLHPSAWCCRPHQPFS